MAAVRTTQIHPRGDMLLLAGEQSGSPERFLVDSQALKLHIVGYEDRLKREFGFPSIPIFGWEEKWPGDCPTGTFLLMLLVHSLYARFWDFISGPLRQGDLSDLMSLIITAKKYDCLVLIAPMSQRLVSLTGLTRPSNLNLSETDHWVDVGFIGWELGFSDLFKKATVQLVYIQRGEIQPVQEPRPCQPPGVADQGLPVAGNVMHPLPFNGLSCELPQDLEELVKRLRRDAFDHILGPIRRHIEAYNQGPPTTVPSRIQAGAHPRHWCQANHRAGKQAIARCEQIVYGQMRRHLETHGVDPTIPADQSQVPVRALKALVHPDSWPVFANQTGQRWHLYCCSLSCSDLGRLNKDHWAKDIALTPGQTVHFQQRARLMRLH